MRKQGLYISILLLNLVVGITACSTQKNTFFSRNYHNLVSHYNIYFNGKESLLDGEDLIEERINDDYFSLLPVYKASNIASEQLVAQQMQYAIEKRDKLVSQHSIIVKPKRRNTRSESYRRLASKEEYNNWVDDSYIMSGKAFFYLKDYLSALDDFDFVLRKYNHEPDSYYTALTWALRCYTELDNTQAAQEIIDEANGSINFPEHLNADFSMAAANFYISIQDYDSAILSLEDAASTSKNRSNRARCHYILAQLYQQQGNKVKASTHYSAVAKMNVPYAMAFSATLSELEMSLSTSNADETMDKLQSMLKESRNEIYHDKIYYIMANIALSEGREDEAIRNYMQSVNAYVHDENQLILSSLKLGELLVARKEYLNARSYYDTLFTVIPFSYPNYKEIDQEYNSLLALSNNLQTIERQDSLLYLASLNDDAREATLNEWLNEEAGKGLGNIKDERTAINNLGEAKTSWYFYNAQTVEAGKQAFRKKWGSRELGDNWRQGNQSKTLPAQGLAAEASFVAPTLFEQTANDAAKERYLADIPKTPEELAAASTKLEDALFQAGYLLQKDYQDDISSIKAYEELVDRYPNSSYLSTTYFALYKLYTRVGDDEQAVHYGNLLLRHYPESNYAQYISNPNFFIELEEQKAAANTYMAQAVSLYAEGSYKQAAKAAKEALALNKDADNIPKLDFIIAVADNVDKGGAKLDRSLAAYTRKYPDSQLAVMADDIRSLINDSTMNDYNALLASGYISENISQQQDAEVLDEFGNKFSYDENLVHYFVIAYDKSLELDLNRLKFDIANYNIDHYMRLDFDIEEAVLNKHTNLLVVKSFIDKQQSLIYLRSIIKDRAVFKELGGNYKNFVISTENYRAMLADEGMADYIRFYLKNYSRFTSGDFPEEDFDKPEELMEKAKQTEAGLQEQGSYVSVPVAKADESIKEADAIVFTKKADEAHQLVIAIYQPNIKLDNTIAGLKRFNATMTNAEGLGLDLSTKGDYELINIGSFSSADAAMSYFRKLITNRSLFKDLASLRYRNFIISASNFDKVDSTQEIDAYTSFFRSYYISGDYRK